MYVEVYPESTVEQKWYEKQENDQWRLLVIPLPKLEVKGHFQVFYFLEINLIN